jgi:hypothetical protein
VLLISWTLSHICVFEFIRAEGGVKSMENIGGGGQGIQFWEFVLYIRTIHAGFLGNRKRKERGEGSERKVSSRV